MSRRILDTNVLLNHWFKFARAKKHGETARSAKKWAKQLVDLRRTNMIVSPVYIEAIVGSQSSHSMELTEAYLSAFVVLDAWRLKDGDMADARVIARRNPWNRAKRDFADCLIRAIANRFRCEVETEDKKFPY